MLVILAALFRLVAGISCCVVVFIVKGGGRLVRWRPVRQDSLGERIFSQSIISSATVGSNLATFFWTRKVSDWPRRFGYASPVLCFYFPRPPQLTCNNSESPHTHASAYIWTTGAGPKFYSVRLIGSQHLLGSSTCCAFTCYCLLQLFRTCYRITQIRHIRLWKNK